MADQKQLTQLCWIGDVLSIKKLMPEVSVKSRVLVLTYSFV